MKERRNQMAGTMSGGEQQMCAIGRALMSRSQAAAARRAVGRPGAGRRAAGLRAGEAHPRRRPHGADRRAERAAGAARRRPRLPAGGRHHPRLRHARPRCWRATRSNRPISVFRQCRDGARNEFIPRNLRHLPARGDGQRHPAGRRAGAAGARAQPDLRRHRRHLDLLRRAGHDRHVRHVLPRLSTTACRSGWPRRSASCWWRRWARCCTAW